MRKGVILSTDVDNFLAHYGVKGMKWGVRRESSPSTKTPKKTRSEMNEQERRKDTLKKIAIGASVVAAAGISVYGAKQAYNYKQATDKILSGERFAHGILYRYGKDDGKVFDKGTLFLRRSRSFEDKLDTRTFVVPKGGNRDMYVGNPIGFGSHEITISALKRVVSPSTKTRVDLLAKTTSLPSDDRLMQKISEASQSKSLGVRLAAKSFGDKKLGAVQLSRITQSEWKSEAAKNFISTLKNNGFSAVWDDWDKGDAHILFDSDAIKYVSSVNLADVINDNLVNK